MAVRGCVCNSLPPLPCHFQVRGGSLPTSDWHEPHAETKTLGEQIEEMRTVAWFREQTERMRLVEEEEAREEFERQEEERIQAERAMEVCVHGSASLHLCMHGVSTVVCGLQDARRREEAVRERKKKDAETAALEAKLKALQQELNEARKSKKEPSVLDAHFHKCFGARWERWIRPGGCEHGGTQGTWVCTLGIQKPQSGAQAGKGGTTTNQLLDSRFAPTPN